jgi:hypothetical protein
MNGFFLTFLTLALIWKIKASINQNQDLKSNLKMLCLFGFAAFMLLLLAFWDRPVISGKT